MNKGQIQQVFIYILTIVVVGLILLLGYKSIGGLMAKGCDVEKTTFTTTLENYIQKYSTFGSFHRENLNAPCGYEEVCFVDAQSIGLGSFASSNPIIQDSVRDDISQNIFLVNAQATEPIGFMTEIDVQGSGEVCIGLSGGSFIVAFDGLGSETRISSG